MVTHKHANVVIVVMALTLGIITSLAPSPAAGASPEGFESDAQAALRSLYTSTPAAKTLGDSAQGILIFPNIVRAGFIFGAKYGEGQLLKGGQIAGYYNIAAASFGLQAGIQSFAYAMFYMTDAALNHLENTAGFEIGVGPTVVLVNAGMARTLTTATARSDVYAFIFGQRGLMAGVGLQGSKITRINR